MNFEKYTINIVSDEDMALLKQLKKERDEQKLKKKLTGLTDAQVWLKAYCATASCTNTTKEHASAWADDCLSRFKMRFG